MRQYETAIRIRLQVLPGDQTCETGMHSLQINARGYQSHFVYNLLVFIVMLVFVHCMHCLFETLQLTRHITYDCEKHNKHIYGLKTFPKSWSTFQPLTDACHCGWQREYEALCSL